MAAKRFPFWATDSITFPNGDPNVSDPGQTKQEDGFEIEKPLVQTMNWILNNVGGWVRAICEWKEVATSYTAAVGETVIPDNSSGAVTVNLPADPLNGQPVIIAAKDGSLFTDNPVTVDGGANDIMRVGETTTELDMNDVIFRFFWHATDDMWKINIEGIRGVDNG